MLTSDKPKTYKHFDVSTLHVTEDDVELLEMDYQRGGDGISMRRAGPSCLIVHSKYPEGFFVYVSDDDGIAANEPECMSKYGYSAAMIALMALARKNYCIYLRVDVDGALYGDLEHFERRS